MPPPKFVKIAQVGEFRAWRGIVPSGEAFIEIKGPERMTLFFREGRLEELAVLVRLLTEREGEKGE